MSTAWERPPEYDDEPGDFDGDDALMEMECDYCDGTGETTSAVDINAERRKGNDPCS